MLQINTVSARNYARPGFLYLLSITAFIAVLLLATSAQAQTATRALSRPGITLPYIAQSQDTSATLGSSSTRQAGSICRVHVRRWS